MPFCQVIVDINHTDVDHVFTYRVPKGFASAPACAYTCRSGRESWKASSWK
ncbi:MAG: hypothetical protein ACLTV6_06655 [Christensenellales bacterium]